MDHSKRILFVLICLGNITISFNIAAIAAVIPLISEDLVLPNLLVAKIITYYLIPYGIGALIYAPLARSFSYRNIMVLAFIGYATSCLMGGLSSNLTALLISRVAMGITAAGAIPIGLMVIGDFFEKEVRGRLVGLFFSMSFIASLLGIALSGFVSWRWLFFVPSVLGFALVLLLLLSKSSHLNIAHGQEVHYLKLVKDSRIFKIFIFIFALSFLYHGVHKWYGIYLSEHYGFQKGAISVFYILTVVGGSIGQMLGGVISDKFNRLMSCRIGIIGLSLTIVSLVVMFNAYVLGLVLFSISMFWTIGHNGISTTLTDFPDADRSVIASLNSSVRFISGGIGFYISQFFVEHSFGLTFCIFGLLLAVCAIVIKRFIPA